MTAMWRWMAGFAMAGAIVLLYILAEKARYRAKEKAYRDSSAKQRLGDAARDVEASEQEWLL